MAESSPPDMQLTPDQNDPARKDGGLALPSAAPASQADASAPAPTSPQPTTSTLRHWLRDLGLQGKLILSFMYLLVLALAGSCWLFTSQSSERVADIMGEQARQISYTLSLASKSSMENRNYPELLRIGQDLLKTRNILFISFLDADGMPIALASREPAATSKTFVPEIDDPQKLMQVDRQSSPTFGEYLAVKSPILTASVSSPGEVQGTRLLGYVVVGISQSREQALLRGTNYLIMIIGVVIALMSFPISRGIVHRILLPIRQLVDASNRIAAGDLDTQVAIHRPDLIGTLARSFNEMVSKIRTQQQELEDANCKLADANVKLAEANYDLESKVHDRTAQLETANRRLSAEIAEKEDFLRAVSHDLNAPLRNISGMATMLLMKNREKFDDEIIHRLERIQKNVQVETDLISELLELSRIKTRRQKLERVELDPLIRELGEVFDDDLRSKGIKLVIDQHLPALTCEKARLRQVFQNLIDNAIKYMGDGPVKEIHIGCQVKSNEVEFCVRDTGIGIDPEDIDKVFFVFRRGKSPAVQSVAGKGVGLASVKSIIETYSGSISVKSAPGKGSAFTFTINGQYVAKPSEDDQRPGRMVA